MFVFTPSHYTISCSALAALAFFAGCTSANKTYSVLAVTGTVIGVEVSANPATQTPQGKLGYNRAELAFVPTNRSGGPDAKGIGRGAPDTADVLMELRYVGIFDTGAPSGIYQRLAVGTVAVQQAGAALMFAKDDTGNLSDTSAIAATVTVRKLLGEQLAAVKELAGALTTGGTWDRKKLILLFQCAGFDASNAERLADQYKGMSQEEFETKFAQDYSWLAPQWRDICLKK